jgi:hypothetical protein
VTTTSSKTGLAVEAPCADTEPDWRPIDAATDAATKAWRLFIMNPPVPPGVGRE